MGMRGWRIERRTPAVDTNGTQIDVTSGIVTNQHGRRRIGLGIGDGPSALLTYEQADDVIDRLRQSADDLRRLEGGR